MAQQNKPDAKALDELKAQIPQMSRKKLGALLLERVKENDVDSVQAILDTVEMSDKKPSGMFDRSLKGTLHPDMLNNALCKAAGSGRNEVIPVLLARGADIEAEKSQPLRSAAFDGHIETVELLIKAGADIDYAIMSSQTSRCANALRTFKKTSMTPAHFADEDGWTPMGKDCIAWTAAGDNGPTLTMVFNFLSSEVSTTMTVPGCAAPSATETRSFKNFDNPVLLHEAKKRLGEQAGHGGDRPGKFKV